MDYKWYDIRKKIVAACKKTFAEQQIEMSGADIEEATDLFDRVVSYPIQYPIVASLQTQMQESLQRSFVDNVGSPTDVQKVLSLTDAYLKKIMVMAGVKTIEEFAAKRPMLKFLLQDVGVSPCFSAITETIRGNNIDQYDKDPTGAYILCYTYLGRNMVHDTPDWDVEEVYKRLRYVMATYIMVTHHLAPLLIAKYPNLKTHVQIDLSEINETGYVYDFINYGNTSNKIKNRILESFILNHVYKKNAPMSIDLLVKEVIAFSRQSLSEGTIKSVIGKLVPEKLNYVNAFKKEVVLNENERDRIRTALDNYEALVNRLLSEIENLLDGYGMKDQTQEVYTSLKRFFENNCMSIIQILNEEDGEKSNERSEEYIEDFKKVLNSLGCAEEQLDEVFKRLLHICALNDVLVKIALGKNFTNVSNPDSFTSGLKQREKKVYLDTQLLLYALCDYDDFPPYSGSPSFLIVKSLIGIAKQNPNIHLATINHYVNEAAYHLKRAVQLISFDDIYHESRIRLSDNVFYSYYYYLKDNGMLNEGIETLSDFLYEMFEVSYEDMLEGHFESQNYGYIADILQQDYGIEIEDTPFFSENDINNSEKVFTTALLQRKDNRSPVAVKKDSVMGLYLFSDSHKSVSEPFFLSWDKTFYEYRKEYIKSFHRSNVTSWHLFSPAKFVNHLDLLDMKINVDVMTEDLISIIEDDDTAANTKRVLDSIRRLLEKSNVNSRQKRKAYSEIIFNETEFPNDTVIPDERKLKLTSDFAMAFDRVVTMMQTGDYSMSNFADVIGDVQRFKSIVSTMSKKLVTETIEQCAIETFNDLVKDVKKKSDTE